MERVFQTCSIVVGPAGIRLQEAGAAASERPGPGPPLPWRSITMGWILRAVRRFLPRAAGQLLEPGVARAHPRRVPLPPRGAPHVGGRLGAFGDHPTPPQQPRLPRPRRRPPPLLRRWGRRGPEQQPPQVPVAQAVDEELMP